MVRSARQLRLHAVSDLPTGRRPSVARVPAGRCQEPPRQRATHGADAAAVRGATTAADTVNRGRRLGRLGDGTVRILHVSPMRQTVLRRCRQVRAGSRPIVAR